MTPTANFIAALILLPAVGLVTWAWFAMAQVEEELRSFSGFRGDALRERARKAESSHSRAPRLPPSNPISHWRTG